MKLFSKILSRAAVPGISQAVPAYPKGTPMPLRRAEEEEAQALRRLDEEEEVVQPLRRAEEEEETAQPLRRAKTGDVEEEEAQTLRRVEEEEEAAQPLRRAEEEEEAQALRRVEEEEEAQALRRMEEEEEAAQPLRRAEEEEEETVQLLRRTETGELEEEEAVQPLRRMEPPDDETLSEPSPLQAIHRNMSIPANGSGDGGQLAPGTETDVQAPFAAFEPDIPASDEVSGPTAAPPPERPRVQIDQIDVVIHEDTPRASGGGESLSGDLARRMRSTYLREL